MANTTLWLYLARRDGKGIRIMTVLVGRLQPAIRLANLSVLQLPMSWENEINQIIIDERMLWEPWLESADSFEILRANLKKRGYTNLPLSGQPDFIRTNLLIPPVVNNSSLPKPSSMIRKTN